LVRVSDLVSARVLAPESVQVPELALASEPVLGSAWAQESGSESE
jgi:hypothetical protein